ncbi:TetR/AcrR family transcriptional regulator [Burkholderia plantarii]|uniref:TetR/AcrR family transcriptional regulator n=1 Tax=Burkholderia plantarii TaxID=41899 RepID=UPI0018DE4F4B|nr:TetR/AcrR family transcriptional regulator [Burkholderia plantarii]MBI0330372.1 TetR/AcrR family transcriptional regulator [Burkholderia plantarii]
MRYDSEHKARTRARIEAVASARFRREGIDAVGVASLMETAGLTHGGFYAHFKSKDTLIAAAIAIGFDQTTQRLRERMARHASLPKPVAFMAAYLNERHRDHPETGCAAATLGVEIGRGDAAVRRVFTEHLASLIDCAQSVADDAADDASTREAGVDKAVVDDEAMNDKAGDDGTAGAARRHDAALAAVALAVGSLVLARAVDDPALSRHLLEAGVKAAWRLSD